MLVYEKIIQREIDSLVIEISSLGGLDIFEKRALRDDIINAVWKHLNREELRDL